MTELTKPTIHLNGSSGKQLADAYLDAGDKLYDALEALKRTAPHARDYYVQSDFAHRAAHQQHEERLKAVQKVIEEVAELYAHALHHSTKR